MILFELLLEKAIQESKKVEILYYYSILYLYLSIFQRLQFNVRVMTPLVPKIFHLHNIEKMIKILFVSLKYLKIILICHVIQ